MAGGGKRNDVAAIHVLKTRLRLSDDDYRALLRGLTGKASCSEMAPVELAHVRDHMNGLVAREAGAAPAPRKGWMPAAQFEEAKKRADPKERKVWALWHQLHRDGRIENTSPQALNAWVARQVGVSALRFCNGAQLNTLIEALKEWQQRRD